MKFNIAYPLLGTQKTIEIEDQHKVTPFLLKSIGNVVPADTLGDEWKGYTLRITGGNDKEGFPMMQGVLTTERVRLLLKKGMKCFRERRDGERKRKSVRGCMVDSTLSVISFVIEDKGEKDIEGLTDTEVSRRLGPKRASHIRKLFNLSKKDDVRSYVLRRTLPADAKHPKERSKAPKIQRLVTPLVLQRSRKLRALKKDRREKKIKGKEEYTKLLAQRNREARDRKRSRSHSMRQSTTA